MGEAKLRRMSARADILRVLDRWSQPPSEWEAAMVAEVRQLPVLVVRRASPEQLSWCRMKPRLCHDNCAWYERNDPTGRSKVCTGWIRDQSGNFVLHAVMKRGTEYVCITPVPNDEATHFDFIPDPAIVVSMEDGKYRHHRQGQLIGVGLRPDPEKTLAHANRVRERIESGMDPIEAARLF